MPRKATALALDLSEEARATLTALARPRTAPAHHVERSAIILHLADRRDATKVAATLRIDRQRVTRCARRVLAVGPIKAIDDLPRSGRHPEITEVARTWLISEACVKAKERGYPHELWTVAVARDQLATNGVGCRAEAVELCLEQPVGMVEGSGRGTGLINDNMPDRFNRQSARDQTGDTRSARD